MRPPKSIVTGGCGFIGSNLIRHLLGSGHQVLNIDKLTYAGNPASVEEVADDPNYFFLKADIADSDAMHPAIADFRPKRIFHLAAESHVDRSIEGPMDFIHTNVTGTAVLLQAARGYWNLLQEPERSAFRFVHISTDEVFGSLGNEGAFNEKSAYDPRSPYSASKAAGDHLVRAWAATYGLPVIITNSANNHGPHQHPEKLIPRVISNALAGRPIPVYGEGENIRDWIHVADHCEALELVSQKGMPGETYLIGANAEWRNIDLVRCLCEHLDELRPRADGGSYSAQITFVADRPGHDFRYAIDATKLRTELGWHPRHLPSDAFRSTVGWYLENESWWLGLVDSR